MRKLTVAEIEVLARRPGVRRTAVENFLSTLDDVSQDEAQANLRIDARLYGWDTPTVWAIREGISLAGWSTAPGRAS